MAVAILTRYLGPTNYMGSRVKAYTETGIQKTITWDDALSVEDNHRLAVGTLARAKGWTGRWVGGSTGEGWAWVNTDDSRNPSALVLP
jgi:hypothetical protein